MRRLPQRLRRATVIALAIGVSAATGCSSSRGSGTGPQDKNGSGPAGLRADVFTAAPRPHNLTVVLAKRGAVTEMIGPTGGRLATTGPDGTTYGLTIPAMSLAIPTPITMVPYADVRGVLVSGEPAHRVGVALYPEGLALALAGTLTITPKSPLPTAGIATFTSQADGKDATLVLHRRTGRSEQLSIPHFSGWEASYPVEDAQLRDIIEQWQSEAEREFQATVAGYISREKQGELLGIDTGEGTIPLSVFEELVPRYERDVLEPRARLADSSCVDAQRAMQTYLAYDRVLQLLGIADNKEQYAKYARPIPESVFEAAWNQCSQEEFKRCVRTGDLPHLLEFFLSLDRQAQLLGAHFSQKRESEGIDLIQRCGQWEAKIDTYQTTTAGDEWEGERDIRIKWQPGSGPFGVLGATMAGEGPVAILKKKTAEFRVESTTPGLPATVEIKSLSFDESQPWYLPFTPPTPRSLELEIALGSSFFHLTFDIGSDTGNAGSYVNPQQFTQYFWEMVYGIAGSSDPSSVADTDPRDVKAVLMTIAKGWQYDRLPYRAYVEKTGSDGTNYGRIHVLLTHTPA